MQPNSACIPAPGDTDDPWVPNTKQTQYGTFVMNRHAKDDPWHGREITFQPQTDTKAKLLPWDFPRLKTWWIHSNPSTAQTFWPSLQSDPVESWWHSSSNNYLTNAIIVLCTLKSLCIFQIPERKSWTLVLICISSTHIKNKMHYFFFLWITFAHLLSPVHSCNSATDCKTLFSNQNSTAHVMGKEEVGWSKNN